MAPRAPGGGSAEWSTSAAAAVLRRKKKSMSSGVSMASSTHVSIRRTVEMIKTESRLYNTVSNMEDQLELALKRKQQELREQFQRTDNTVAATFRLFVSDVSDMYNDKLRKVRIFGRVLSEKQRPEWTERFSQLFRKADISLTQGRDKKMYIWTKHANDEASDGLEMYIDAADELLCDVGVALYPEERDERCRLSKALSAFMGSTMESRSKLFMSLWQYIKDNKLQDGEKHDRIWLDKKLSSLIPDYLRRKFADSFTRSSVKMSALVEVIRANVKSEVIQINATLAGPGDQRCFDIQVEIEDDALMRSAHEAGLFGSLETSAAQFQQLKRNHQEALEQLSYHRRRRNFFTGLYENPTLFIDHFMLSQARELSVIAGGNGRLPEEERLTRFYESRWVHEAMPGYLMRKKKHKEVPPTAN
eukprot:Plantae.Rhodophyta-Purpureofilum_apyrenoidigerum.ctg5772.p1 GENE.Plantae.Rhodophyta-Purpureofilum_apyrenoidigerum.ctg5772~~Plantae.Rhodophyta-Purpureofilum_apyrenoidigerum.ctg5772.p1  ORF type:complete len:418 (-),score=68.50 Plantae.Rhodophyta-Purpureofilum_apyrenoidigerum.ctg5772:398-1651(-)